MYNRYRPAITGIKVDSPISPNTIPNKSIATRWASENVRRFLNEVSLNKVFFMAKTSLSGSETEAGAPDQVSPEGIVTSSESMDCSKSIDPSSILLPGLSTEWVPI